MQYGSIGWAVGATLGYASAVQGKKRVILSVGDGSFQVTAQVTPAELGWEIVSCTCCDSLQLANIQNDISCPA